MSTEETPAAQDKPPYSVEYAPSGRSRCRACKETIEQGQLRFTVHPRPRAGQSFSVSISSHLACAKIPKTVGIAANIAGYETLNPEHQQVLDRLVEGTATEEDKERLKTDRGTLPKKSRAGAGAGSGKKKKETETPTETETTETATTAETGETTEGIKTDTDTVGKSRGDTGSQNVEDTTAQPAVSGVPTTERETAANRTETETGERAVQLPPEMTVGFASGVSAAPEPAAFQRMEQPETVSAPTQAAEAVGRVSEDVERPEATEVKTIEATQPPTTSESASESATAMGKKRGKRAAPVTAARGAKKKRGKGAEAAGEATEVAGDIGGVGKRAAGGEGVVEGTKGTKKRRTGQAM